MPFAENLCGMWSASASAPAAVYGTELAGGIESNVIPTKVYVGGVWRESVSVCL